MQIAETLNEGLKRAYTLTITAKDIESRIEGEVRKLAPQMKMPGFRPGKVPANLVRKMHGPQLFQDALNTSIKDGVQKMITDHKLRPAMQPAVELNEGYEQGKDAEIKIALEVLPDVPAPQIEGIKLERLTAEIDESAIDAQIATFLGQQKSFDDSPKDYQAATGDLVIMDYLGKVDGEPFDGGKGEGMSVEIGSGRLIPGFEDQLVGVKASDEKQISVTFPDDYNVAYLKGKPATFDLVIKDVRVPKAAVADDDFAKTLGLESLEQLRGLIKGQIEQEHNGLTRTHMKRKLLDHLAASHDFAVPPSMVEAEFNQIWAQLEQEATREEDPVAARAEMENDKADYRAIAERRVRLGLLLSEIGQGNGIDITSVEMNRLIQQAAAQYDAKDRERFVQYVQQEPMAAAQLRAPLYEDKVVDFLFSKADITDRAVLKAELEAAIEDEDGARGGHVHGPDCGHDHAHDEKPKTKKTAVKKTDPAPQPDAKSVKTKKASAKSADLADAAPAKAVKKPTQKKQSD